jgi:murein DD-endopeptidase MepM/ murein hydrolase activator NlpD
MPRLSSRVVFALGLIAVAAFGVGAGAATDPAPTRSVSARALAIGIVVPGGGGGGTAWVAAPPSATPVTGVGFTYPDTGAVVTAVATSASAAANASSKAVATAGVTDLVLFGGEITADSVLARASAVAGGTGADGDFDGTTAQNVQVFGSPASGEVVALADWGTLTVNAHDSEQSAADGAETYRGSVAALDIRLTADHGGLPAGSEIQIGYAEAAAQSLPAAPESESETVPKPTSAPAPTTPAPSKPEPQPAPKVAPPSGPKPEQPAGPKPEPPSGPKPEPPPAPNVPAPEPEPPPGLFPIPPELSPSLEGGPYVFPVFGSASYGDTYGDFRGDVTYHHGDDIFGELGRPLVAVADGTVFSVGWNKIGGNRLWLRDRQGNAFYYAHLSAFSTLIFNGAHVRAGQVVGFMGNTGDAETTPVHLHFEVHPVSLLYLGYDGAVDPTPYLDGWRRLARLPFPVPPGWAPGASGSNAAPQPGAILLDVSDISSADGLDPPSLQRAIEAPQARP